MHGTPYAANPPYIVCNRRILELQRQPARQARLTAGQAHAQTQLRTNDRGARSFEKVCTNPSVNVAIASRPCFPAVRLAFRYPNPIWRF